MNIVNSNKTRKLTLIVGVYYGNLEFIDRSFKDKTREFVVCVVFLISAGRFFFFLIWPITADCETIDKSLVFLERCLWLSVIDWLTQVELFQNATPFLKSTVCDNSNPGLKIEACIKKPHFALSQNTEFILEHPTSVFCKIFVRISKYCLEFYITWEWLKISRWSFYSCKILDACLINSLRFSEV